MVEQLDRIQRDLFRDLDKAHLPDFKGISLLK
jgi:hypothetical protein